MGMAKNTRKRGREQAGMSREGRRTMEKVLENTVRDTRLVLQSRLKSLNRIVGSRHWQREVMGVVLA